ncbi:MAG TPA: thiamine pyrophosphate-dependent enzyme [Bacillota bacterium]|jgi:2-oxoglutarate ferredoxin oxidoreductase subunit beta
MPTKLLTANELKDKYIVSRNLPSIWCSGCGVGTVLGATMRAIDNLGLDKKDVVFTIGIGCSGYSSKYVAFDVAHTTHGRALTTATGLKLANPKLKVITLTGDGDGTGIGGNHFIHAARRNIDITAILFNNSIYGMTGGQYSPATPTGSISTTSPYGMVEGQIDPCELAVAAGATYVARASTYHVRVLQDLIAKAIAHKGFSLVEAITQCPNQFGRLNKIGAAPEMMKQYKEKCVRVNSIRDEVPEGKLKIGELYKADRPEYTELYAKVQEEAQRRAAARAAKGS